MSRDLIYSAPPTPVPTGSQRGVISQSHRYQWEQQWLRENRNASAVVTGAEVGRSGDIAAGSVSTASAAVPVRIPASPMIQPVPVIADARTPVSEAAHSAALAAMASAPSMDAIPMGSPLPAPPIETRALATDTLAESAPPVAQGADERKKSFALWRSGTQVEVAMRLDESEHDGAGVLAALRRWLKNAGFELTRFTVNGRTQWRGSPRNQDGF